MPATAVSAPWPTLPHYPPHPTPTQPNVRRYDGVPVDLTPEQEEVATFFAVMKETGARWWWVGLSVSGLGGCDVMCRSRLLRPPVLALALPLTPSTQP